MADRLKRWHEPTSQWIEVMDINRIELMPPQETNSPKMISAINIGATQTEITFDKPLLPFDEEENTDAFYVLAEWYWTQTAYPVTFVEQVTTTMVRLTHADISDVDGSVRLGYNQNQGTVRGENGYLVLSHFKSYQSIFPIIKIRIRAKLNNIIDVHQDIFVGNLISDVRSIAIINPDITATEDVVNTIVSVHNHAVTISNTIDTNIESIILE